MYVNALSLTSLELVIRSKEKCSVQKSYEQDKKHGNEDKQICSYLTD